MVFERFEQVGDKEFCDFLLGIVVDGLLKGQYDSKTSKLTKQCVEID
jgi:hypothetical protein